MGLFGRKSQEEIEEKEDISPAVKIENITPRPRAEKKEIIKPWGKTERLIVLVTLVVTVGISGILALSNRDWKLPGLPRLKISGLSLNLPAINIFSGQTIVIDGGEAASPKVSANTDTKSQKVISEFSKVTSSLSGTYGLYVIRLDSGFSYGINTDEVFEAASLIKLPTLVALYKESESGRINLETKYILKDSDKIGGSGSLQYKKAGTTLTYRELARLMGKQSDNTAFNVVRKTLGDDLINKFISEMGMNKTSLANNETSVKDIGILYQKMWQAKIVSPADRDEILSFLTDTIYEDWLKAGVPDEIKVAHKYGREVHVVNDAGIIFTDKPYVAVIMSKGVIEKEADEHIAKLSKIVYDLENDVEN